MNRTARSESAVPIVVVDDNRLLREGIVAILDRHPDLQVVAVADSPDDAAPLVSEHRARVVLVDAGMGDYDSHGLVKRIVETFPEARVIVMDILPDPEDVVEFIRCGASGFVVKDASVDAFVDTIRKVADGSQVLPPTLTSTVFSQIADNTAAQGVADPVRFSRLTQREHEVIDLNAEGMTNKAIGRALQVSPHTVKSHVHNILEKLALHSRLQVAMYALSAESSPSEESE